MNNDTTRFNPVNWFAPVLIILSLLLGGWLIFARDVDSTLVEDWLAREGGAIFSWWFLTTLAGLTVFPIFMRLLPQLPSHGYAVARAGGLMLIGFVFWYLASLGLWANTAGSMALAWLLVAGFAAFIWSRGDDRPNLKAWWQEHWVLVVTVELAFVILFVGWAMYRAHEPEIRSTEKPMEMMFVNSIRESDFFPPNDGWLAGYSISYYYFGYVLVAFLADLSAVNTGLAFGLAVALIFALAGVGILGLVYDLVSLRRVAGGRQTALLAGMLGLLLLVICGNLGMFFIELPWNGQGAIEPSVNYFEMWRVPERSRLLLPMGGNQWEKLQTGDILTELPNGYTVVRDDNLNGKPDWKEDPRGFRNWDFWWWFRYSRLIDDRFLNGEPIGVQPIAEFPHFSFILADMHPHLLALPFTLLALTLGAGVALRRDPLTWWMMLLLAIWVGGMAFMNSWDAVYIVFLVGAFGLRLLLLNGRFAQPQWLDTGAFAVVLAVLTVLCYFPWIFSFTSQAGGFYLNIIWSTSPPQLFLQFGQFFLLLIPFIMLETWRGAREVNWLVAVLALVLFFLLLVVILPLAGAWGYHNLCEAGQPTGAACRSTQILLGGVSPSTSDTFWDDLIARRAESYGSHGLILAVVVWIGFRLMGRRRFEDQPNSLEPVTAYVLLLLAAGLLLIFIPDFIYLVDNFRVRINTVFKLYYQAWVFLSVATAYGAAVMVSRLSESDEEKQKRYAAEPVTPELEQEAVKTPFMTTLVQRADQAGYRSPFMAGIMVVMSGLYLVLIIGVLGMAMVYPYYASRGRGLEETGRYSAAENNAPQNSLTLDGRSGSLLGDEYAVISCLLERDLPPNPVVAEAPYNGGYNMTYGRVATLTGIPNLLGWINHEGQWRGATFDTVTEVIRDNNGFTTDSREMQADKLFRTTDWAEAEAVIKRYGIDFVMIGEAEFSRYEDAPDGLEKFEERYDPICQAGNIKLYQVGG